MVREGKGEAKRERKGERKKRSGKRVFEILYFCFPILGDPVFTENGGKLVSVSC